jgi:hypothetical protein
MINSKSNIMIRKAERQDVPLLLKFIRGIARSAKHRLLPLTWSRAYEGMDGVSA